MKTEDQANNISEENKAAAPEKQTKVESQKTKQESKFNRALRSAGYAFLFFLLGALIVGLVLYLPANSKLKAAQAEVERLSPIESNYTELQTEFEQTNAQRLVYKILSNASMMRVALVDNDSSRIDQYVRYIEDDLANLSLVDFPDLPATLTAQFSKVSENVSSNRLESLNELQDFQNDLLLLIDNLE